MEVRDKLRELIQTYGPTQKDFAQRIGTTQPTIANWIATNKIPNGGMMKICRYCENVSLEWLSGEEEEWKSETPLRSPRPAFRGHFSSTYLSSGSRTASKGTPFYTGVNASCGQKEQNTDDLSTEEIYIPGMHNDAWITAEGRSMLPTLQPGDRIGIRRVEDLQNIRPGNIYLIETSNNERMLKRIRKNDPQSSTLTLVSDNETEYAPFDIEKASIIRIYMATSLIRSLL